MVGQSQAIGISLAERVLHTVNPEDHNGSLERAYLALTGEHATAESLLEQSAEYTAEHERLKARGEKQPYYAKEIEQAELDVAVHALVSIFTQQTISYSVLLNDWPVYQYLHTRYVQPVEQGVPSRPKNAVSAGVLTALSAAAFSALAEDVFDSRPYLVDPRAGRAKRRHGTFVQANILTLPREWSNTMHIGLTSNLLSMLLDETGKEVTDVSRQDETYRLLDNMLRITEPGGHLMMIEAAPGFDRSDMACETAKNQDLLAAFEAQISEILQGVGYTDSVIETAWTLPGVDYLFDPERNFASYKRIPVPKNRIIYARKPLSNNRRTA